VCHKRKEKTLTLVPDLSTRLNLLEFITLVIAWKLGAAIPQPLPYDCRSYSKVRIVSSVRVSNLLRAFTDMNNRMLQAATSGWRWRKTTETKLAIGDTRSALKWGLTLTLTKVLWYFNRDRITKMMFFQKITSKALYRSFLRFFWMSRSKRFWFLTDHGCFLFENDLGFWMLWHALISFFSFFTSFYLGRYLQRL
jgi:hypothetical protein